MSKKHIVEIVGACLLAAAVAFSLAYALGVHADTRGSMREGVEDIRTNLLSPPPAPAPSPSPDPEPTPPASGGGITTTTSGEAGSGGNQGGEVVTGDESVVVHTVNEGPTNSNTVVTVTTGNQTSPPPPPDPEPTCDPRARDCRDGPRGR